MDNEEKQFFMIWNPLGHCPTYRHFSHEQAEVEARRLARENPGQTFYVMFAVERYKQTDPIEKKVLWDGIPF